MEHKIFDNTFFTTFGFLNLAGISIIKVLPKLMFLLFIRSKSDDITLITTEVENQLYMKNPKIDWNLERFKYVLKEDVSGLYFQSTENIF